MVRVQRLIRVAVICATFGVPLVAQADEPRGDPAMARSLFDEARSLVGAGKYAEACPKFEASQRIDPGIGTQFNLADCYERVGKTASAWSAFLEVASQAKTTGQSAREKAARERAAALEPKLSRLTISVPPSSRLEGLSIQRDGIAITEPVWNSAVVIDPGKHRVVASAPGHKSWNHDADIAPNGATATVVIPALEAAAASTPSTPAPADVRVTPEAPAAGAGNETAASSAQPATSGSTLKTIGLVAAGVGIVGLGAGTYFGLSSKSKEKDVKNHCDNYPAGCDEEGLSLNDEAKSAATIATIGFVAGGLLVAGGAAMYLFAPATPTRAKERTTASVRLLPAIGANVAGWSLQGQW